ncbi:flavin reductase [Pseudomonas typographi]|uniref:flavin reductase n=1 Tax=Pseudomonas typographi TaxID=2715964 RepID=UPI0016835C54|nr:flavin reductase [Pseudomonas typographi]MBD1588841.1 FMN reductase [Pseudomonas typographi]
MIAKELYRDAMARLGAAVNIVTTTSDTGPVGFTASAVCSVTDDPPTLLVCMNRSSKSNPAFKASQVLCVNTLAADQEALSTAFATLPDMGERFRLGEWDEMHTCAPSLKSAVVNFDCRIKTVTEVGTHSVFFCEVEDVRHGPTTGGLIYFSRNYHQLIGKNCTVEPD